MKNLNIILIIGGIAAVAGAYFYFKKKEEERKAANQVAFDKALDISVQNRLNKTVLDYNPALAVTVRPGTNTPDAVNIRPGANQLTADWKNIS